MSDFWSRRRAGVAAEAQAEDADVEVARRAEEAARREAMSDEALLAEAGLPDPDTIETPDQVQDFLKSALPKRLKSRALRKLWGMNPILANVDGLVDYGEDYTDAATVVENMQTVYQVGKGMFDKFAVKEDADVEEPAEAPEAAEVEPDKTPAEHTEPPAPDVAPPAPDTIAIAAAVPDAETVPAAPRRMRFRFET